ncbi:hypothetical protein SPOG_01618 [Schizosaccharomyces cryophilus OY26]|uniref:Uncharacterized protein n=1 Tax=Schizosaccharomyces cryophilus (strain OY26 / ATCC MYA-4695 / CBS 11777 / NBRC 106824 / NRRL Y48691) TaxID=653667 RepID=S9VX78_SCHCR|nr:uncharacterized protein SPOG_01618 [Schizosaccharomyces cryophilus OY26]EPY52283.1 hypothetical protein SPOG_01618 [Schizosaccharomyces cryophilus OY26]
MTFLTILRLNQVDPQRNEKEKQSEASAGTDSTYGYDSNATEGYSSKPEPTDVNNQKGPIEESKTAKHFKGDVEEVLGKVTENASAFEKGKSIKEQ